MKKNSTHYQLHTIDNAGYAPEGEDPSGEEEQMDKNMIDPGRLLNRLDLKVPDRVMKRLFLRIRISTLRNKN